MAQRRNPMEQGGVAPESTQPDSMRPPMTAKKQPMPQAPPPAPMVTPPLPQPDPQLLAQGMGLDGGADQGGMLQLVMELLGKRGM